MLLQLVYLLQSCGITRLFLEMSILLVPLGDKSLLVDEEDLQMPVEEL